MEANKRTPVKEKRTNVRLCVGNGRRGRGEARSGGENQPVSAMRSIVAPNNKLSEKHLKANLEKIE